MAAQGRDSGSGGPPEPPASGGGSGGMVALLSLNLLLLAFFILLTALATFEQQRLVEVVRSVNETFQGRVAAPPREDTPPVGDWPTPQTSATLSLLGQLFRANFPLARMEVDPARGEMRMELDAATLFPGEGAEPGAAAHRLLDGLVTALQSRGGEGYELEFFHGYDAGDRGRLVESEGSAPVFLRTGALIGEMTGRGIAEAHLSGGLLPGSDGQVRVVLRLWGEPGEPASPRRTWR